MNKRRAKPNGRISVHTYDMMDELLEDISKHELQKVSILASPPVYT